MVQAMLFIDKTLTIEAVCEMNPLGFMKKYEACMNLISKKPVVSLNSGNGLFDYAHMINSLYDIYIKRTGASEQDEHH